MYTQVCVHPGTSTGTVFEDDTAVYNVQGGFVRYFLFLKITCTARVAPARTLTPTLVLLARVPALNHSSSKLKFQLTDRLGSLLLFSSRGRGTCESKYTY